MPSIHQTLQKLVTQQNLTELEIRLMMHAIVNGTMTPAQLGGFLTAMRMKGETVDELVAAIKVLREFVIPIKVPGAKLVDIVGTGGDQTHTFNISTTCAFVVAAAGASVAKYGNRSLSSNSGSADVLEKAGMLLTLSPQQVVECIKKLGIGFIFAPQHHTALKHATLARKDLGIRTFFNLIGPLTHPANAQYQLVGVFSKQWIKPVAEVLKKLGSKHALVVHSKDGLDEISIAKPTYVAELKNGRIETYEIAPKDFGFKSSSIKNLKVKSAEESLQIVKQVLNNQAGAARDIVALNSGAAIYVAGLAKNLATGIDKALATIASGAALKKFEMLIALTQKLTNP